MSKDGDFKAAKVPVEELERIRRIEENFKPLRELSRRWADMAKYKWKMAQLESGMDKVALENVAFCYQNCLKELLDAMEMEYPDKFGPITINMVIKSACGI